MKKNFFHGLWARSYFKGFSTPKCCSFQVFFLLNVWTFFIVFYNNKHSFIFLLYKALIIYLTIPEGIVSTCTILRFNFFNFSSLFFTVNGNIYFISKSFPLYLANPIRAFVIRRTLKNFFWSTKFVFTEGRKLFFSIFSFSFPLDSARGCRAKVWYRTRNTPARLGFAPDDSQPCEPCCLFPPGWCCLFLLFLLFILDTLSMVTWYIIQLQIY